LRRVRGSLCRSRLDGNKVRIAIQIGLEIIRNASISVDKTLHGQGIRFVALRVIKETAWTVVW
jgi:hypothetical protein